MSDVIGNCRTPVCPTVLKANADVICLEPETIRPKINSYVYVRQLMGKHQFTSVDKFWSINHCQHRSRLPPPGVGNWDL